MAMAVKSSVQGHFRARVRGLALICLTVVAVNACAGGGRVDPATASSADGSVGSEDCNGQAVAGAQRLHRAQAGPLRARELTLCEVRTGSDGSTTFEVTRAVGSDLDGHDFVSLVSFDGGPVPAGCSLSLSSRLFVLIEDAWVEARQVGCGADQ